MIEDNTGPVDVAMAVAFVVAVILIFYGVLPMTSTTFDNGIYKINEYGDWQAFHDGEPVTSVFFSFEDCRELYAAWLRGEQITPGWLNGHLSRCDTCGLLHNGPCAECFSVVER